ncbi:MAG: serine/threonine-protein kinase [Deltaproteobacteria bacterium]|nr:serine/threonine-protein kinase [Deltaproteobacteria bacterium]
MSEDLIGKEILGQFRFVELMGRGGMGEVYKAEQPAMDRLVAIKLLHSKLAARPDLVSRFRREARAMSRLTHPNTVRVFLYGQLEDTGQLYIVMEYLNGVDLARITRKQGAMEMTRAIRIMIQVLGALEEAHTLGIVHRDLKPENIMLTTQGGIADFPKVLDFGLAKMREENPHPGSVALTQAGMVFGTPEFMSPEQARGETLDPRSDVYSVGVILYEMLTARLPFPRCKPMEYIAHHIQTPPIPISERQPDLNLPKALDHILGKALEKSRDERYQSAREFAEALRTLLPRSAQSTAFRALPAGGVPAPVKPSAPRASAGNAPGAAGRTSGKGLIIGLMCVIVVLLALVAFLLATGKREQAVVVPLNPVESQPRAAPGAP